MANIINNTQKANHIPTNGNCKGVRDITNDIHYDSMTVAAMAKGVRLSSLSYAVKHETPCKGSYFVLESELYKSGDKLCAENAKANRRAAKANARANKAEARVAEMESELAEFRKWKAEQEAIRKAEEERLERERKEEEKRQAKVIKLEDKIERLETLIDRKRNEEQKLVAKRNKALNELKALNDGKEVK